MINEAEQPTNLLIVYKTMFHYSMYSAVFGVHFTLLGVQSSLFGVQNRNKPVFRQVG